MDGRVEVDWRVPAVVWNKYTEQTLEEYDGIEYYIARNVELAMEEAIGWDRGEQAEELTDRLVSAAGRRPCDHSKNKIAAETLKGVETVRVRAKVHPELKDAYSAYMKEHSEHRLGIAFAYTLLEWLDGRRVERIARKLERVTEDAEGMLADYSESEENSLSPVEKRTINFCAHFRKKGLDRIISRNDIRDKVGEHFKTESTIDQYEEAIVDRLNLVEHPENPQLYIRADDAEQIRREKAEREATEQMNRLTSGNSPAVAQTDGGWPGDLDEAPPDRRGVQ